MGDALAAFARPRMLPCAVKALGISIIAYFHIPTIPQCAAQAAPVPRLAFQTYAVRDLCEKDFADITAKSRAPLNTFCIFLYCPLLCLCAINLLTAEGKLYDDKIRIIE